MNPVRDLVARIYEEELRKLMSVAELKGNAVDATTYEREIKRLSFLRAAAAGPVGAVQPPSSDSADGGAVDDKENVASGSAVAQDDDDMPQDLSVGRRTVAGSPDSPARADAGSSDEAAADGRASLVDGMSPLQRMQCIANSLPATTVTQSVAGAASSRQLLPPITTEQMAACEETNTDEVVAKVRISSWFLAKNRKTRRSEVAYFSPDVQLTLSACLLSLSKIWLEPLQ